MEHKEVKQHSGFMRRVSQNAARVAIDSLDTVTRPFAEQLAERYQSDAAPSSEALVFTETIAGTTTLNFERGESAETTTRNQETSADNKEESN